MSSALPKTPDQVRRYRTPSPPTSAVEPLTPVVHNSYNSTPLFNTGMYSDNYSFTPSFNNANTHYNTSTVGYTNDPHSFVFNNTYQTSYHSSFATPLNFSPVHPSQILRSQMSTSSNYQAPAPPAQMSGQPQYQSSVDPTHVLALPKYQPYPFPSQNPVMGDSNMQNFPSQVPPPSDHQSSILTPQTSTPPAPTPPDADPKVVLILLLDHGTSWASSSHQDLIHQLKAKNYDVIASSPASAALSITRYNPSIILLYEAKTLNKKCNRKILTDRLQAFTQAGGILIFGGVPWAFNLVKKAKAKTVFNTAFRLDWTVGEDNLSMIVGDCTGMMQKSTLRLHGTYLHNVPLGSRVYRPYPHNDKDEKNMEEPCAVALQVAGDGCMGYIGSKDLYSGESRSMLVKLLVVAEGLARCRDGKTPAEVMTGGKLWAPPGWVVESKHDEMEEDGFAG